MARGLGRLLREADDGRAPSGRGGAAVLVIAGIEGLCLERIERGETRDLAAPASGRSAARPRSSLT